jgi:hypothetical protein
MSGLQAVAHCPKFDRFVGLAYEVIVGSATGPHRHIRRCALCLHVWETISWLQSHPSHGSAPAER